MSSNGPPPAGQKVSPADAPTRAATPFNVEAKVFVPLSANREKQATSSAFNPDAAEFVPTSAGEPSECLLRELAEVIRSAGMTGIRVNQLPHQYRRCTGKWLVVAGTRFEDLSETVDALKPRVNIVESDDDLQNEDRCRGPAEEATEGNEGLSSPLSMAACCPPLGRHGDKIVVDQAYGDHPEELQIFRRMIVVVVREFCRRSAAVVGGGVRRDPLASNHPQQAGLALSLFAAEWDRYYQGAHSLKSLRERFGVVKLMPFLRTIKELDLIGTHPEVRVRVKPEYMLESPVPVAPVVGLGGNSNILSHFPSGRRPSADTSDWLARLGGQLGQRPGFGTGLSVAPPPPSLVNNMAPGESTATSHLDEGAAAAATAFVAQQLLQSQQQVMQQLLSTGPAVPGGTQMLRDFMAMYQLPPLMGGLGAAQPGSSAAMDSLIAELLSTSSPDLGHVEEVVKQLEGISADLPHEHDEDSPREMWLSLATFRRLIVKVVDAVCRAQDTDWRGNDALEGEEGRALAIGCSLSQLADKWREMYPRLRPLQSFYQFYFTVDDPETFLAASPQLWVIRSAERGCHTRVSTVEHVERYCSPRPGRLMMDGSLDGSVRAGDKLRWQLQRLTVELVSMRCQQQRLEEIDRGCRRGDRHCRTAKEALVQERRRMEEAVKGGGSENEPYRRNTTLLVSPTEGPAMGHQRLQRGRPAPIDTSRSPERSRGGEESIEETLEGIEVEGVLVDDSKKEWYEVYSRHLQPLLDTSGLRKVQTLVASCRSLVIEGQGSETRCSWANVKTLSYPATNLTSIGTSQASATRSSPSASGCLEAFTMGSQQQPAARPSIVTPETVPLPTPIKVAAPPGQDEALGTKSSAEDRPSPSAVVGRMDDDERLTMERLLKRLILHREGPDDEELRSPRYSKVDMLGVRCGMVRHGRLDNPPAEVAAVRTVSERRAAGYGPL
ncbi:hypothetical protein FOL46_001584 [Perkinsus olseni]|uniref:Uncharacterized protein n=1 Tax=Perkinsus olseni TaxID=32597 RepID=A0A7J6MCP8_PEROL|nr:hypothetical protein FOL46_001584 [Perkinsus olseni]